jgi:hypothetical protein
MHARNGQGETNGLGDIGMVMEGAVGGIRGFWTRSLIRGSISVWVERVLRRLVGVDVGWLSC